MPRLTVCQMATNCGLREGEIRGRGTRPFHRPRNAAPLLPNMFRHKELQGKHHPLVSLPYRETNILDVSRKRLDGDDRPCLPSPCFSHAANGHSLFPLRQIIRTRPSEVNSIVSREKPAGLSTFPCASRFRVHAVHHVHHFPIHRIPAKSSQFPRNCTESTLASAQGCQLRLE